MDTLIIFPYMNMEFLSICLFFNFFQQSLTVLFLHRFFALLVKFIPRYFFVFDAVVNGVSLFTDVSLVFVFRSETFLC